METEKIVWAVDTGETGGAQGSGKLREAQETGQRRGEAGGGDLV